MLQTAQRPMSDTHAACDSRVGTAAQNCLSDIHLYQKNNDIFYYLQQQDRINNNSLYTNTYCQNSAYRHPQKTHPDPSGAEYSGRLLPTEEPRPVLQLPLVPGPRSKRDSLERFPRHWQTIGPSHIADSSIAFFEAVSLPQTAVSF